MNAVVDSYAKLKLESEEIAHRLGYPINHDLPPLDPVTLRKNIDNVITRMLILNCVVAVAHGFSSSKAKDWLSRNELLDSITDHEQALFNGRSDVDRREFMVQGESLWAFSWIIGKVEKINFSSACDDGLVRLLPDLLKGEPPAAWMRGLQLRQEADIIAACDLSYRIHWAIRDAHLLGRKSPGQILPYVVIERRRALEWMLQESDWDSVILDT